MPSELDTLGAEQEPQGGEEVIGLHGDEPDREGAMAKADLFKLANYAHKLFQQIDDNDQLEGWVQAKITKAADYIASVYHYLEYEMKFSEYGKALDDSDVLSESQKSALKNKLMEAKTKVKELKKAQAEKVKESEDRKPAKKQERDVELPSGAKVKATKVQGWQSQKADKEANKEKKKNDEIDESENRLAAKEKETTWTDKSGKKHPARTVQGHQSRKADKEAKFDKKGDLEEGNLPGNQEKIDVAEPKGKITGADLAKLRKAKKVKENKAEEKADDDYDGDGRVESGKAEYLGSKIAAAKKAGKLKEGQKCTECGLMMEKCSCEKVEEASKPSAGLSKAKKSAVVKKAKKGGDIGKPGKGFKDAEAAAKKGGAKNPKEVAAAAMWKNIKRESQEQMEQAPVAGTKPATTQIPQNPDGATAPPKKGPDGQYPIITSGPNKGKRWSPQTPGPTNPAMKEGLNESQDIDRIKELTQRLLG